MPEQKTVIALTPQERMLLEQIVMDEDGPAAVEFAKQLLQRVKRNEGDHLKLTFDSSGLSMNPPSEVMLEPKQTKRGGKTK